MVHLYDLRAQEPAIKISHRMQTTDVLRQLSRDAWPWPGPAWHVGTITDQQIILTASEPNTS